MIPHRSTCGRLVIRKRQIAISLDNLARIIAQRYHPAILGANSSSRWAQRFSIFTCDPIETVRVPDSASDPLSLLARSLDRYRLDLQDHPSLPPGIFCGGWIGYFNYDLCRKIEQIQTNPSILEDHFPLIGLGLYDRAIVFDHTDFSIWLIAVSFPDDRMGSDEKLDTLEDLLQQAARLPEIRLPRPDSSRRRSSVIHSEMSRSYYDESLRKIHRYILDGEVYQINFARQFSCPFDADPLDLFVWHNQHNPSPYAAFVADGDLAIVSASPEMFLTIHGEQIRTQPIKGTRPRIGDSPDAERFNRLQFQDLAGSEKEQAELNMIIDLERNDLHRICRPGTVEVIQPRTIEAFPTLFHAVATIAGSLRRPPVEYGLSSFCEILRAVFPGGSITGAPKIRAMQIIEQLEPVRRGIYTGSIGFLGLDGSACLNIAIRTCIISNGAARFSAGGGIVVDSDTCAEWDETQVKARALLAGLSEVENRRPTIQTIS
ncbi:MAG: anthranilate synthase component I family protein [Phycisphaerae bacterium]|nr:anthranilate synthase component I family protein [Phycisphaerae bacterium]